MEQGITVGMDMGDKNHRVVALDTVFPFATHLAFVFKGSIFL